MENSFDALLTAKDTAGRRVRSSLEGKLMTVLLIGCILVSAFFSVVQLGIVNPFDPTVWVRLGNQLLTSYLVFLMFIDPGERSEFSRIEEHGTVRRRLAELSERIGRDGLMADFRAFCRRKEIEASDTRRRLLYSRYVDEAGFAELVALKPRELRRRWWKEKALTYAQYRAVRRAKHVRVRELRPDLILSSDPSTPPETLGGRITYRQRKVMQRPVMLVFWNVLIHSMSFLGTEAFSVGMLISILTSTFSIVVSAFVGYDVGRNSAVWQTAQRESRIRFLLEFDEWKQKEI
jgi:hypothetical protein